MEKVKNDYLKYWKVIKQYYKSKYSLTQADPEMLLFLFSEGRFTSKRFKDYSRLMSWDTVRFVRLKNNGWIEMFREGKRGQRVALYQISDKGRKVILDMYRKLNGEDIPMQQCNNPMYARSAKYTDKVHLDMIAEMNEFNKQRRHRTPE